MVSVTGVLTASLVVAVSVPLTRLAHHALMLHFLTKQLEHSDASARLEVSLVIARQMGTAELLNMSATYERARAASVASVGPLTQVETKVRSHRR